MRRFLALVVACVFCAGAYADIDHYIVFYQPDITPGSDSMHPNFNNGSYYTVDLMATITGGDDWTSSALRASLNGASFFCHALGDRTPAAADLVLAFPALEFDTMVMSTESSGGANVPDYADPDGFTITWIEPRTIIAAWFGIPPNAGDGDWMIGRFTVHVPLGPPTLFIEGASTTALGGGELYPFQFEVIIPEPAALSLLGVGLALIRRR